MTGWPLTIAGALIGALIGIAAIAIGIREGRTRR